MILVGRYRSPFTRRVGASLILLGIAFERRAISSATDPDALARINPVGRVPALVLDDGETLVDSACILDHLDELAGPERALVPPRGAARRQVLKYVALAVGATEKAVQAHYAATKCPPDKVHEPWVRQCEAQAASAFAWLDANAAEPWLAGPKITQADVTALTGFEFARLTRPAIAPAGRFPRLEQLLARASELPAFADTRPEA